MKKVIKQDFFLYIGDIEVSTDSDGDIEVLQWNKGRKGGCDIVTVGKSKAREVAISICPELGEPTIKTDNTKVILHLESELESMKEERKAIFEQINTGLSPEIYSKTNQIKSLESELKEAVELIEEMVKQTEIHFPILAESGYYKSHKKRKAFLTKHKSKE